MIVPRTSQPSQGWSVLIKACHAQVPTRPVEALEQLGAMVYGKLLVESPIFQVCCRVPSSADNAC